MEKVGVIGPVSVDLAVKVKELPDDHRRHINSRATQQEFGGTGAMLAIAMAKQDLKTAISAKIGSDPNGLSVINNLKENDVNVNHIIRDFQNSTGLNIVLIDWKNNATSITAPGANNEFEELNYQDIENFIFINDVIVFSFGVNYEMILEMMKFAKKNGKIVVLNTHPMDEETEIDNEMYQFVDYLIVNQHQLRHLIVSDDEIETNEQVVQAANSVLSLGTRNVIITLAENGCMLLNNEVELIAPPVEVSRIKRAGANEAFIAGVVKMILEGTDPLVGLTKANQAAAYAISRDGYQDSLPTLEDIDRFLQERELLK